ncbi:acyltransferase domain protein [Plesiocystis pacifica SIR-1]|uniref:Acyltransferase domain protein n=1 Tax=Plesiocystis pacifica SIR-1 TaxID=391625 RepID=A6G1V1_9BACT|nr:lysophospholipid acyltransferase family protein [Plesiocystis pacifica]EDM80141.1 acyltransferase domain protein [Plesiocystis pacifica SIR-1]
MRALMTALCRFLLRIFFRRIESVGMEQVPAGADTPVLFVLNHPNALLDPLFILCRSPRPVTFLAKAPLFDMVLVKHFVRAFECLPVYRERDGADPKQNRKSVETSIALLASGKALALFPEGISHSEPLLAPLKTGAARIALSASAGGAQPVQIVPVGLNYADKKTFRSDATLVYGAPLTTPVVALDERSRPPKEAAQELTDQIADALGEVIVQSRTHEAVELARATARVLSAAARDGGEGWAEGARASLDLEQRLIDGYEQLQAKAPRRLEVVVRRVRAFEAQLDALGMGVDHPAAIGRRRALRWTIVRGLSLALLVVPGVLGILTHWLPYRAVDFIAHRLAPKQAATDDFEDVLATLKLTGGLLFFPLTWVALAVVAGLLHRWSSAGAALLVLPLLGFAALRFVELTEDAAARAWAAWQLLRHRDLGETIAAERAAIRDEVYALAELVPGDAA